MATAAITIYTPPAALRLPDNDQWTNRFEIRSETSDRIYIIAQNKPNVGGLVCAQVGNRTGTASISAPSASLPTWFLLRRN